MCPNFYIFGDASQRERWLSEPGFEHPIRRLKVGGGVKRSAFLDQIERDAEGTFVATARGWRSVQGD
jgi:hypothetical protein